MSDTSPTNSKVGAKARILQLRQHDTSIQLIEAVKRRSVLYQSKSADYRNIDLKTAAWKEVHRETDMPSVEACQKLWKSLRDRFIRELRAQENRQGAGEQKQANKTAWPYFEHLLFYKNCGRAPRTYTRGIRKSGNSTNWEEDSTKAASTSASNSRSNSASNSASEMNSSAQSNASPGTNQSPPSSSSSLSNSAANLANANSSANLLVPPERAVEHSSPLPNPEVVQAEPTPADSTSTAGPLSASSEHHDYRALIDVVIENATVRDLSCSQQTSQYARMPVPPKRRARMALQERPSSSFEANNGKWSLTAFKREIQNNALENDENRRGNANLSVEGRPLLRSSSLINLKIDTEGAGKEEEALDLSLSPLGKRASGNSTETTSPASSGKVVSAAESAAYQFLQEPERSTSSSAAEEVPSSAGSTSQSRYPNRKRKSVMTERQAKHALRNDEDELFAMSLVPALKRLSAQEKSLLKVNVMQCFSDAECGKLVP